MVKLFSVLNRFKSAKVLLIGDFMLDTYTRGKVKRISPEAPVPVLHVEKQESLPGGAGNVALNIVSLGGTVHAIGRVGLDTAGDTLLEVLKKEGVNTSGLIRERGFQTPVKNRLIADSQQVIRIDFEKITPALDSTLSEAKTVFDEMIADADIVAISDYGKGFLSKSFLQEVIAICRSKGIPVVVDPKGDDFTQYSGATLIKPNISEAYSAAKLSSDASLDAVAESILQKTQADMLMITRSEHGISIFSPKGKRLDFPVRSREVIDVTGAGDTVLAMISMALASKLEISYAAQLANVAAGIVIERLGCARINLCDMASSLLESDLENKIFDEEHLFALQQALKGKQVAILGVESHLGMSTQLFRSIRTIATKASSKKLIIYVRDEEPDEEFVSQLASLSEVDFIILKRESFKNACQIIHPDEVYLMEQGELTALTSPSALLAKLKNLSVV